MTTEPKIQADGQRQAVPLVMKSYDPSWPKWSCSITGRQTQWFDTYEEAEQAAADWMKANSKP